MFLEAYSEPCQAPKMELFAKTKQLSAVTYFCRLPFENSSYETLLFRHHQAKGHLDKKIPVHFSLSLPQLTSSDMIFHLLNLPDLRDRIVRDFHRFAHCFLTIVTPQLR